MSISQINAASIQPGTVIASDIAANTITQSNLTIGAPYWNSSNQVGIGTTTPGYQLDVQGPTGIVSTKSTTGTNTSYFISNNTGGATAVGIDSSSGILTGTNYASFLWSSVNSPIIFSNNSTERMRIDTSGNVGIGTITPASAGGNLNLVVQTSGAASIIKTTTSASSSSAVARYDMSTGTGNSYSIIGLHDNSGSPYFQLTSGSAVTANYYDAATHYFRSLGGANWLTINSSGYVGIGTSSPQGSLDIGVGSLSSNPTYLGTLRLGGYGSQSLASNGGIEFMAATTSSGYGWRIGGIDLGSGNVPFVYQYRMNSTIWSEAMRIDSSGNIFVGGTTQNTATGIVYAKTTAKAWAKWGGGNQTTAGSIFASYNCSSITVNSTGRYTFNFTNAMASANYAISALTSFSNGNNGVGISANQDSDNPPSSTRFDVAVWTSVYSNSNYVYASVFA
jgi:hypothetical protein